MNATAEQVGAIEEGKVELKSSESVLDSCSSAEPNATWP